MNIVFWLIVLAAIIIFWFSINIIFVPLGNLILSMIYFVVNMIKDFKNDNKKEDEEDEIF